MDDSDIPDLIDHFIGRDVIQDDQQAIGKFSGWPADSDDDSVMSFLRYEVFHIFIQIEFDEESVQRSFTNGSISVSGTRFCSMIDRTLVIGQIKFVIHEKRPPNRRPFFLKSNNRGERI